MVVRHSLPEHTPRRWLISSPVCFADKIKARAIGLCAVTMDRLEEKLSSSYTKPNIGLPKHSNVPHQIVKD